MCLTWGCPLKGCLEPCAGTKLCHPNSPWDLYVKGLFLIMFAHSFQSTFGLLVCVFPHFLSWEGLTIQHFWLGATGLKLTPQAVRPPHWSPRKRLPKTSTRCHYQMHLLLQPPHLILLPLCPFVALCALPATDRSREPFYDSWSIFSYHKQSCMSVTTTQWSLSVMSVQFSSNVSLDSTPWSCNLTSLSKDILLIKIWLTGS